MCCSVCVAVCLLQCVLIFVLLHNAGVLQRVLWCVSQCACCSVRVAVCVDLYAAAQRRCLAVCGAVYLAVRVAVSSSLCCWACCSVHVTVWVLQCIAIALQCVLICVLFHTAVRSFDLVGSAGGTFGGRTRGRGRDVGSGGLQGAAAHLATAAGLTGWQESVCGLAAAGLMGPIMGWGGEPVSTRSSEMLVRQCVHLLVLSFQLQVGCSVQQCVLPCVAEGVAMCLFAVGRESAPVGLQCVVVCSAVRGAVCVAVCAAMHPFSLSRVSAPGGLQYVAVCIAVCCSVCSNVSTCSFVRSSSKSPSYLRHDVSFVCLI